MFIKKENDLYMYDYHIHMDFTSGDTPQEFLRKTAEAGVTGGAIISPHPLGYVREEGTDQRWENLLAMVLQFTSETPTFLPVFWIDPTDADISRQIEVATEHGVSGFKIICNHFYPKDILKPMAQIAETGLPVNFHCGILYSTHPAAEFNRPAAFECLMEVKGLRFSLAHAGWPWTDEFNSIIGEFFWGCNNVDVYVDLTPGTPLVYRREVLRRLYLCGFQQLKTHILWGTDKYSNHYNTGFAANLIRVDREILNGIIRDADMYRVPTYPANDFHDIEELLFRKNMETFFQLPEKG